MARALSHDTRLLILDEPSAVLDQGEVDNLFRVIRGLTAEGVAVVYISHRLEEIRQIGDRITVLKDGSTVATGLAVARHPDLEADPADDRPLDRVRLPAPPRGRPRDRGEPVLEVRDLALAGVFSRRRPRPSTRARSSGSPASSVPAAPRSSRRCTAPAGPRPARSPSTAGSCAAARSPRPCGAGIGLAPEERKSQGLLLDQSVYRNITVSSLRRFARAGFLNRGAERRTRHRADHARSTSAPPASTRAVRTLSGGNQQKVVLARWLLRECRVLLLDEPTRGVDVGARSEIYALVRTLADSGVAVVVVSSEVEEVLGLADRVLVVREGAVVHEVRSDRDRRVPGPRPGHGRKSRMSETPPAPPRREPEPGDTSRRGDRHRATSRSGALGRCCARARAATSAWSSRWC